MQRLERGVEAVGEIIIIDNRCYQTSRDISCHSFSQQVMIVVATEALEIARKWFNAAKKFDAHHPDGEKSQIFSKLTA